MTLQIDLLPYKVKELISLKEKRDKKKFNINQLAKAIDVPHSVLVKLLHQDKSKRSLNPKLETLTKIVNFFIEDGFDITLDQLLNKNKYIKEDIISQNINKQSEQQIPLISKSGNYINDNIKIKIRENSGNIAAHICENDINSVFKKSSIFIIDKDCNFENNSLIAFKNKNNNEIQFAKIFNKSSPIVCQNIKNNEMFSIDDTYDIIGSVIQIIINN